MIASCRVTKDKRMKIPRPVMQKLQMNQTALNWFLHTWLLRPVHRYLRDVNFSIRLTTEGGALKNNQYIQLERQKLYLWRGWYRKIWVIMYTTFSLHIIEINKIFVFATCCDDSSLLTVCMIYIDIWMFLTGEGARRLSLMIWLSMSVAVVVSSLNLRSNPSLCKPLLQLYSYTYITYDH